MKLYARPLASALKAALRDTPVVCLLGPRQSGKTTLARTLEPRYAYVTFDDATTLAFAQADPTGFVAALPKRAILDEVQRVPELLRTLKLAVRHSATEPRKSGMSCGTFMGLFARTE